MTHPGRTQRLRRAGLATAVLAGCGLVGAAQVPAIANAVGLGHSSSASAGAPDMPDFLAIRLAQQQAASQSAASSTQSTTPAAAAQAAQQAANSVKPGFKPTTTNGSTLPTSTVGAAPTLPGLSNAGSVGVGSASVPNVLEQAYQHAAATAPASCHIPVSLLAAIGQVESGSLAGQSITSDHRAYPGVYGPELNGTNGYAAIPDTDKGVLDGDKVWDRAVGPMQFIPGTWRTFGVDADGDGRANPQDVFDAAATAAKYLCYGGRDLSTAAGINSAVLSYNNSSDYLALVLRWKQSFDGGQQVTTTHTVPNLPNKAPTTTPVTPSKPVQPTLPNKGTTNPTNPTTGAHTAASAAFTSVLASSGDRTENFDASASTASTGAHIKTWAWDFGDGSKRTMTTAKATHVYTAGTYTVKLTVTDTAGHTSTVSHQVAIKAPVTAQAPVAKFVVASTNGSTGLTAVFDASASMPAQGLTYAWDFGDGKKSTEAKPTHPYAAASTGDGYKVTLTVTNKAGVKATATQTVVVKADELPTVTGATKDSKATDTTYVADQSKVSFDAADLDAGVRGSATYKWSFSDGKSATSDTTAKTTHEFVSGTSSVKVTLTITDKATGDVRSITFEVKPAAATTATTTSTTSATPSPSTTTKTVKKNAVTTPSASSASPSVLPSVLDTSSPSAIKTPKA